MNAKKWIKNYFRLIGGFFKGIGKKAKSSISLLENFVLNLISRLKIGKRLTVLFLILITSVILIISYRSIDQFTSHSLETEKRRLEIELDNIN
ncbi:MAG: hypothetical protein ACLFUI_01745, partial [Halanaerobiales bacterium]